MTRQPDGDAGLPSPGTADIGSLVERVKSGSELNRSPRLRQLLEYLCERSLTDPGVPLTEERIGVEVFGRSRGYDTGADTIVRVQVSQLRKKLEHHFQSEGAMEPIVIELPKRSYMPVFRHCDRTLSQKNGRKQGKEAKRWRNSTLCLAALLAISIASLGWLVLENRRMRDRLSGGHGRTPFRDHFWSQVFQSDRQTQLVASDANAMFLCDFLGRTLTPSEYISSGYPGALFEQAPNAPSSLRGWMDNSLTNMSDLRVASRLTTMAAASGGRLNIVFARDFRHHPQTPDNLVLLSHRKANPWVGLFEGRMNFRYDFDAKEYRTFIVNRAPKAGEQPRYPVEWGTQTFALIARLRKPIGEGIVLLLEGTDVGAAEAGCDLLTDEGRIKGLYARLGIHPNGPVPDFEVLLRASQLRSSVQDYVIVAHRLISP